MARIRTGFVSGTITNNPLASGGTTMNASALANLAAISSPDIAVIVLDADGSAGSPEIIHVTAHTGSATSATISRSQEGSTAREHVSGTDWVHSPTVTDFIGAKGTDISSTASMTLPDNGQDYFDITGTTTITSISERASGRIITFQFDAALVFTHNATNLILLGAENITTVAGDTITLVSEGSGNWREIARKFPWPTTTVGDIDYADGVRSRNRLAIGTALQKLRTNSGATAPEWADDITLAASAEVTDTSTISGAASYTVAGTVTFTTNGGDLLCFWTSNAVASNNSQTPLSRFQLDGGSANAGPSWAYNGGHETTIAHSHKYTSVSAASHTVTFEITNNSSSGVTTVVDGAMIVIEVGV